MKKICFVVTDAVSFNVLCKGQLEFLRDNLEGKVWLLCGGSSKEIDVLVARSIGEVVKIPFVRKPSLKHDILCLMSLIRFFSRNRFDLVVYSTPKAMFLSALATAVTFQKNRLALVRGRAYENYSGFKRHLFSGLDKVTLSLSHKIIYISKSLRDVFEIEGLGAPDKGVVLGYGSSNGVNTERFKPGTEPNTGRLRVAVVGRICIDKGMEDLYQVVQLVKEKNADIDFEVIGSVEDECSELLLDSMVSRKQVVYSSHRDDVEEVFRDADLLLFLSHREGFGNVALEAAASGIPTFAFDVVGVKDSVESGVTGQRFELGDTRGIADMIITASENVSEFRSGYPRARKWAVDRFSQPLVWESYKQFYNRLLNSDAVVAEDK